MKNPNQKIKKTYLELGWVLWMIQNYKLSFLRPPSKLCMRPIQRLSNCLFLNNFVVYHSESNSWLCCIGLYQQQVHICALQQVFESIVLQTYNVVCCLKIYEKFLFFFFKLIFFWNMKPQVVFTGPIKNVLHMKNFKYANNLVKN